VNEMLRLLLVTPDMHRRHHSAYQSEIDSNFTVLFSFWDRLFGTYRAGLEYGRPALIGLSEWRAAHHHTVASMLSNPFVRGNKRAARELPRDL
jgi:sterol desaturase/sphingolipid hydroxylase (fatty acid hydroxylase superfamily)